MKPSSYVKIRIEYVDELFRLASLLITIEEKVRKLLHRHLDDEVLRDLKRVSIEFYNAVTKLRLLPLAPIFEKLQYLAYGIARSLGKEIEVFVDSKDISIDRRVAESLPDILLHLVKNAIDHGIEPPEERIALGKPRKGKVKILAERVGNYIVISVEDDGRGIDVEKVKRRALELGLVRPEDLEKLSWNDIVRILTVPGFTTKDRASAVSGRGVGLDAVKEFAERLGGYISIYSERGKGTRVQIYIPFKAIAIPVLIAYTSKGNCIAIPIDKVYLVSKLSDIYRVGRGYVLLKNELVKLVEIDSDSEYIVILRTSPRYGLTFREIVGYENVIAYPISRIMKSHSTVYSGVVLFEEDICLVLDVEKLCYLQLEAR